jgi:hypothetical protein
MPISKLASVPADDAVVNGGDCQCLPIIGSASSEWDDDLAKHR